MKERKLSIQKDVSEKVDPTVPLVISLKFFNMTWIFGNWFIGRFDKQVEYTVAVLCYKSFIENNPYSDSAVRFLIFYFRDTVPHNYESTKSSITKCGISFNTFLDWHSYWLMSDIEKNFEVGYGIYDTFLWNPEKRAVNVVLPSNEWILIKSWVIWRVFYVPILPI